MQMNFSSLRLWACLAVVFAVPAMAHAAAPNTSPEKAAPAAVATPASAPVAKEELPIECATCHKEAFDNMAASRHGASGDARTPWGKADSGLGRNEMCTACHGKAGDHIDDPIDKKPETLFNKSVSVDERNARCLACHIGGNRIQWQGSTHEANEVACSDCHKVHIKKDPAMVMETQPSICFNCHKTQRAAMMRVSTHPLRNGQMGCSSCHQPHGTAGEGQLIKATVNETCYTCHADKRGPYLWPHEPVRENCDNCHQPHGSNTSPMLQTRQPYLCMTCHDHHSATFNGNDVANRSTAAQRMVGTGCANCHPKVHGSNHPSGRDLRR